MNAPCINARQTGKADHAAASYHTYCKLFASVPLTERFAHCQTAMYSHQRNSKYWLDAETFRPERFLDTGAARNPAYAPFGEVRLSVRLHLHLVWCRWDDLAVKKSFGDIVAICV